MTKQEMMALNDPFCVRAWGVMGYLQQTDFSSEKCLKRLQPIAEEVGATLVKMTRRPFGVVFTSQKHKYHLTVHNGAYACECIT